ncbi:hypothetical protein OH77DRAFT_1023354 [Trametes cingulata]|nr:hypothetical protein OH77DRAFT_1023354 [Trametes cingulata]
MAWGVRQRLSTLSLGPMSGDKLIEFVCQAGKLMILHEMIMTDPDASEEHQTSLSAWTGEVLCEVKDALTRVDSSEINFENLWNLVEFLEELVLEVHTLTRLLVHSDFMVALRNLIDRVKSRPDYDENDSSLGYWIRRCKSALQELESKLQGDIPVLSTTETHASAAADLGSTPQAGPSKLQSVREQSEEQVSGPANSSDAVGPANLATSSYPASPPVDTFTLPVAAFVSLTHSSEPVQEQAERILDSTNPSDTVESAMPEPVLAVGAPLNSCYGPASASHSPPPEPAQEQREGSPGAANLSNLDDTRPEPTSSSGPRVNAPFASHSDTTSWPPSSPPGQDERKDSLPKKAGNSADTANPATPDHTHPEPASSALSGGPLPPCDPAASASKPQTPPWHPLQDEVNGCHTTRSDPIEPCDDDPHASTSAEPSSPPT